MAHGYLPIFQPLQGNAMDKKSFLQAGHFTPPCWPPLPIPISPSWSGYCSAHWASVSPRILACRTPEKGLMVFPPVLAGPLLRIVMGILVDRLSPKKAAIIGQVVVIGAMLYAWLVGVHSYAEVLVLGVFLDVAGSSFAAALPLASRWYPAEHQGTAMGIAGAGNSGTALAAFRLNAGLTQRTSAGSAQCFGIVLIPLVLVLIAFIFMAKGCAGCTAAQDPGRVSEGAQG